MEISALNFFRNLKTEKQQFAVIGLGRFGRAVCAQLHESGYDAELATRHLQWHWFKWTCVHLHKQKQVLQECTVIVEPLKVRSDGNRVRGK